MELAKTSLQDYRKEKRPVRRTRLGYLNEQSILLENGLLAKNKKTAMMLLMSH